MENAPAIDLQKRQCFLQGLLFALIPMSLFSFTCQPPILSGHWQTVAGITLPLLLGTGMGLLFKRPAAGKTLLSLGMGLGLFLFFPAWSRSPLAALFTGILILSSLYYLFSGRLRVIHLSRRELHRERFLGSALGLVLLTMFSPLFVYDHKLFSLITLAGFLVLLATFGLFRNAYQEKSKRKWLILLLAGLSGAAVLFTLHGSIAVMTFFLALAGCCYAMIHKHADLKYFSLIINHPGRSVFLTFALLCAAGTLLLRTPAAMNGEVDVIDAAFTSVSGVCVTGLSVIDIAQELTLTGRFFLLILIQAGGLGIMTLAAVILRTLGRRLSLGQEQVLTEMTAAEEQDVFQILKQIIQVTFVCETLGALLLIPCFFHVHGDWGTALELGIFTSISAFCNAGFFPGATNMIPYSGEYFMLIVTALLIISGGIAPAVTVALLRAGRKGDRLPLVCKLVIGGTIAMLAGSTFLLLLFEWNGIFNDLSATGKIVNGFFLAASLRTAGFNTVAMEGSGAPAVLIMLFCMFIGGSPGGTAGGIKVTTLAILVLTLRAAIRGREVVELDRHRVPGKSVIHAVAIFSSAALVLLTVIMMLVTTQTGGAKALIFESFSALGTVGLSLGATGELDFLGKIIIMATMFIGRIGPLTLFLLFSDQRGSPTPGYPPTRIPLG